LFPIKENRLNNPSCNCKLKSTTHAVKNLILKNQKASLIGALKYFATPSKKTLTFQ